MQALVRKMSARAPCWRASGVFDARRTASRGMLAGPSRGVIATLPLARAAGGPGAGVRAVALLPSARGGLHGLAHRAALCSSAGKAAEAPAPSSSSAPSSEKRLHSSDIAFKPTTDGWGYSHVYGSGWDNIFKKKGHAKEPPPPSPPTPDPQQQQQLSVKLEALDKALGVGALSPALYEQARRELE